MSKLRTVWLFAGMVAVWFGPPGVAHAEYTLQVLYRFPTPAPNPWGVFTKLIQDESGAFYGTSILGGTSNSGSVFKFTTDGTLTTLFSFNGSNGYFPSGGLVRGDDGNFYGFTIYGGDGFVPPHCDGCISGKGTAFRITTNGEVTPLLYFNGTNGSNPVGLLLPGNDGNFYGTTLRGGSDSDGNFLSGKGTVFKVTTNGVLSTLLSFTGTNGSEPEAGLARGNDDYFYGTTFRGGDTDNGTVFRVTTNGVLTSLVSFSGTNGRGLGAPLTLGSDGNFYGTTSYGGSNNNGTVFKVTTNGVLTTLFFFNGANGTQPSGELVQDKDGSFYGATSGGGSNNLGTLYRITTNGSLTTLVHIDGTNGIHPYVNMILSSDGNLYGAMADGNINHLAGGDNIFRLVRPPVLTAIPGTNDSIKLSWGSFTNGLYRLEYKSSLTDASWSVLAQNVTATSNIASFTDTPGSTPARLYRVVLLP